MKSANIYSFYSKKFQVTPAAVTAASASASVSASPAPAQTQSQQITTGKIAQTAAQQQPVVAGQNSTSTDSPSGSLALKLYPAVMIILVAAILNIWF